MMERYAYIVAEDRTLTGALRVDQQQPKAAT